jgi:phage tail sheath gpL-like
MTTLPLAVSPATKTPGFYLTVNLLAGTSNPGTARLRALIIAPKALWGSAVVGRVYASVAGPDVVKTLAGPGTPAHLASQQLFTRYSLAAVDFIACPASPGASASGTITLSGAPTASTAIIVSIKGVTIGFAWNVGISETQAAAALVLAINALSDSLPVVASNAAGVVTLSAKMPGAWGNDVLFSATIASGAGGQVQTSGDHLDGGALDPDVTSTLSKIATIEYQFILPCVSNADAENASGTSNLSKIKGHMAQYATGLNARLQQCIFGATPADASALKAGVARLNDPATQVVYCQAAQELGCELAGFEVGDRLKREELEYGNPNRIGTVYDGFLGPVDPVGDKLTDAQVEDLLNSGVSPLNLTAQNDVYLIAPITTHSQDASGNPDFRVYYVTEVSGAYGFARDLRSALPQEFYQVKIVKDQPQGSEPLPPATVEERDVKAFAISRARFFQRKGVIRRDMLDQAIADGSLIVVVDDTDPAQVDIVFPVSIVKPLAKFSTVVQKLA